LAEIETEKCLVLDCDSRRTEGPFFGNLCGTCYMFLFTGQGQTNAVIRLATKLLGRRFLEKFTSAKIECQSALYSVEEALLLIKEKGSA
jgi:hypothetical protein